MSSWMVMYSTQHGRDRGSTNGYPVCSPMALGVVDHRRMNLVDLQLLYHLKMPSTHFCRLMLAVDQVVAVKVLVTALYSCMFRLDSIHDCCRSYLQGKAPFQFHSSPVCALPKWTDIQSSLWKIQRWFDLVGMGLMCSSKLKNWSKRLKSFAKDLSEGVNSPDYVSCAVKV